MHRTVKYFVTFTLKCFALTVAAISTVLSEQQYCWTKFYNFCAALLILRMTANSVCADSQNSDIPNYTHAIASQFICPV